MVELSELDEVAVVDQGADYWDVYVPFFPGSDGGEYWGTVGADDLVSAQRQGVSVYDRTSGREYEQTGR